MIPRKISVILSTFNRAKTLYIALLCLCRQDDYNFEIIVADDGSDQETAKVVNDIKFQFPKLDIFHIWQEKNGFRLARIRNLAVKKASGDYLIFLDGDCLTPPNFIRRHRSLAEEGWAVYGQRVLANQMYSKHLEANPNIATTVSFWDVSNFLLQFIHQRINRISPILSMWGKDWRKRKPYYWQSIRGCNWAMWHKDYIAIYGSDESFEGWGSEDKDVAVRLINNKIKMKDGRNASFVLHLWHPYATRDNYEYNLNIVKQRSRSNIIKPNKSIFLPTGK